jgi:hypothetical protein
VGTRFFGGGREKFFVDGDPLPIRGHPVLRSMGNNEFSGNGTGSTTAGAFNLTVALPWRQQPLVPADLRSNEEFRGAMAAGMESAISALQNTYVVDDPQFRAAVASLPRLRQLLHSLKDAVLAAQAAKPGAPQPPFRECLRAIDQSDRRAASAITRTGPGQLGALRELLPAEAGDEAEDRLGAVQRTCAGTLNAAVRDEDVAVRAKALAVAAGDLLARLDAVDQPAARRKAQEELRIGTRALKLVIDEMNLWSVSPLLMFDAVHMNVGGTRYGAGLGLRLTLANSVSFSVGYMANQQRRAGEPRGAFLMSLEIRDIF